MMIEANYATPYALLSRADKEQRMMLGSFSEQDQLRAQQQQA
jgi:hypothetical protein